MLHKVLFISYALCGLYCYMMLDKVIGESIELFKQRHPSIPVERGFSWAEIKLNIELILISMIPLVNVALGFLCQKLPKSSLERIVTNVELDHWKMIRNLESKEDDLDKYF